MHAVICAAGEGRRMRPLTEHYPKALLPIGEKTVIEYMLDNISTSGIMDVIIVVGYKAETVYKKIGTRYKNCTITYVLNEEYKTTNNIYSLYLAREHVTDGMVFFNGDIVFHKGILHGLLSNKEENSFAADPFSPLESDAMKVILEGGRMRKIGKHLKRDANAWAIGIYKLSQAASEAYFKEAEKLFAAGEKNISFVVPFQAIVKKFPLAKHKVLPEHHWVEIDTPEDYKKAVQRINSIISPSVFSGKQSFFKNETELITSAIRGKVLFWAHEGITAALPERFMHEALRFENGVLYVKNQYVPLYGRRVFVIGAGKASAAIAVELEKILGPDAIQAGVVVSNDTKHSPSKIEIHKADHPIPSERSVEGAQKILSLKNRFNIGANDILIALISGGGSSLFACPAEGISLPDKQKTVQALIKSGANVHEITVVKKKISAVKGGKLAAHFDGTPILSLILSDVVGNDVDVIASGPLARDMSTYADALSIIRSRGIESDVPESVISFLERNKGSRGYSARLEHVHHEILADNNVALERIRAVAEQEGVRVVMEKVVQGEAKEVAYKICSDIHNYRIDQPTLFLFGGETTVTLDYPHKKGGRNQEFVTACLQYLSARPFKGQWVVASVGTDGVDFIEESMGAIIDHNSPKILKEKKLDTALSSFLESHKTGRLLEQIHSNIKSNGPTGTNVCDIMMFYLTP